MFIDHLLYYVQGMTLGILDVAMKKKSQGTYILGGDRQ